jgi:hypothetical protein
MNTVGPPWGRSFSPYRTFGEVPVAGVANALRQHFLRWGLPERFRVDNGSPWGSWNDLPTPFALWVVGLGIDWHWNDPHCPQQNPKIERGQGTAKRWAEPQQCDSVAQLQAQLDRADQNHREYYRLRGGQTRLELFPQLKHAGRPFTLAWEKRHWNFERVEAHLSEYIALRTVSAGGHITIYHRARYVGKQFVGQQVQLQYDPEAHAWLISDRNDRMIRHVPAPEITQTEIVNMSHGKTRQKE